MEMDIEAEQGLLGIALRDGLVRDPDYLDKICEGMDQDALEENRAYLEYLITIAPEDHRASELAQRVTEAAQERFFLRQGLLG